MTDLDLYLKFRCQEGFKERDLPQEEPYLSRLEYELEVITRMAFSGYFLIVSDFLRWALSQNIMVGPGRGSGAGSLVAYCLKITHLDPIKHGLLFERFLNPSRIGAPVIELDEFPLSEFEKIPVLDLEFEVI